MNRRQLLQSLCTAGALQSVGPWKPVTSRASDHTRPTGYIRTNWSRDPFARGSYSFLARGSRRRDRRTLEEPIGNRLFFAGEAVYPDYTSTVHAAYESGVRTAQRVLEDAPGQSIAIIGAGMSGLSCAKTLYDAGRPATLFEARSRIGGRVWTDNSLGLPLDLGAGWIHGITDNPLTTMADDHDIGLHATSSAYVARGGDGRIISNDAFPAWLEDVAETQHLYGADSDTINHRGYWLEDDYDGGDAILPDGYNQLLDRLLTNNALRLDTPVAAIAHDADGVLITPSDHNRERYNACVITLPLGVLKAGTVAFQPALPQAKQNAIARLGYGVLDKVYLRFDAVFWDRDVPWILTPETGHPRGWYNQWLNLYPALGEPVLCAFNGGSPAHAIATLPDEEVIAQATRVINAAYGRSTD